MVRASDDLRFRRRLDSKVDDEPVSPRVASLLRFAARPQSQRSPPARVAPAADAFARQPEQEWRGTCALCLDLLPLRFDGQRLWPCCCKSACTPCFDALVRHGPARKCPYCRAPVAGAAESLRRLQSHVAKGSLAATLQVARAYHVGAMGLQKDLVHAFDLYQLVAAQNHPEAEQALGGCYAHGLGCDVDLHKASHFYARAAAKGLPPSQFALGTFYYGGATAEPDAVEAVKWWRLAARQGHADAQTMLAKMLYEGKGVARSRGEAAFWFGQAVAGCSSSGSASDTCSSAALSGLAFCSLYGHGVPRSVEDALELFDSAVAHGCGGSAECAALVRGALVEHKELADDNEQRAAERHERQPPRPAPLSVATADDAYAPARGAP
ncbi:hypothetical protein M885DRAFT_524682 [Pelagophyceae sp. CCMP2097]|nr:hypothetical protein M885DRAFT_524682 [Pelagophyceae sp. CCMP2097]